jgi:di/tricarboxylate transporter
MTSPVTITVIILGIAILLLLSDRVRPDLVALMVMLSLGLTGIITIQETFSGFSRTAVITILAIFILAEGLQRSGVTDQLGGWLLHYSGSGEIRLVIVVTLAGACLSLFMNNIAAAAVLLPAVMGASRKLQISPARLLIPLAFGTILGGMATLFTTTNIVASSLLRDQGMVGFGVLDFLPMGIPIVLTGIGFMAFFGRRLLPGQYPLESRYEVQQMEDNLGEVYQLKERLVRARVPPRSPLAGKQLDQSNLRESYNLNLIALERNGQGGLAPSAKTIIQPGDHLLLSGRPEEINQQLSQSAFILLQDSSEAEPALESPTIEMIETVLAPRSNLIGQTLRQAHFREKYEMNVIAIWRAGRPIRTALSDLPLQFGDALLLLGSRSRINLLRSEPNLILLRESVHRRTTAPQKAWLAIFIMGVSVVLSSIFSAYIGEIMLGGALMMVLVGILTMDEAYRAIDWKTIFIIAGMLPLGIALANTGAAAAFGNWALGLVGPAGPQALLATLVLLTVLFTQIMNGAVVTAILVPIGISIAKQAGLDPRSLTMGIALAASMAFITPFGHPVNLLVMGPAGYRTRDYLQVGLPLTIILVILVIFLLPVFWPLS